MEAKAKTMENPSDNETSRLGKRAAENIGSAVNVAGQKLDAVVDYVESTKQSVQQALGRVRQDGWRGTKERVTEYTRREPGNALLVALGTGLILGWLTKRIKA
jgi:hypothetical protein